MKTKPYILVQVILISGVLVATIYFTCSDPATGRAPAKLRSIENQQRMDSFERWVDSSNKASHEVIEFDSTKTK